MGACLDQPEAEAIPEEVRLSGKKITPLKEKDISQIANRPLLEARQQNSGLIILGDPGAGKTTFLKYLALRLAGGGEEELGLGPRLPILVLYPQLMHRPWPQRMFAWMISSLVTSTISAPTCRSGRC